MSSAANTPTVTDDGDPRATAAEEVDLVVGGRAGAPVPDRIGRHVVARRLGAGGMGVVYEAYDPDLDRRIAIKLLRPERRAKGGETAAARVMREAQAMARIAHPNVIQVFDVGRTEDDAVYIAMEFVEGDDLDAWVKRANPTVGEILEVYAQAGAGLAAAHMAGLVHRDFKPANALRGRDGRVRVLDFGLARAGLSDPAIEEHPARARAPADRGDRLSSLHPSDDIGPAPSATHPDPSAPSQGTAALHTPLTRTGAMLGTPAYMAPEQFQGAVADARSDQFSFCVSLWKALYGERPFEGRTVFELSARVLEGKRRVPREGRRVPVRVERALERGLRTDPRHRFEDMGALVAALTAWSSSSGRVAPRQRRWVIAGVGLGLAAAAAAGTWWLRTGEDAVAERSQGVAGAAATNLVPTDPSLAMAVARERAVLGEARELRGRARFDEARSRVEAVRRRADALAFDPLRAEASALLGGVLVDLGEPKAAEAELSSAYYLASEAGHERAAATAALELTRVVGLMGARLDEADVWWKNARTALRRAGVESDARLAFAAAALEGARGHYQAALEAHLEAERALPGSTEAGLRLEHRLAIARLHVILADFVAAETTLREADSVAKGALDPDDPRRVALLAARAELAAARGDMNAAVAIEQRGVALSERVLGSTHPSTLEGRRRLAERTVEAGAAKAAVELARDAALALEHRHGPDHPAVATALRTLGKAQIGAGELDAARETLQRARGIAEASLGPQSVAVAQALASLGTVAELSGQYVEARDLYRQALRLQRRVVGELHPWIGDRETQLASAEFYLQDYESMAEHCQRALAVRTATLGKGHPDYPIAVMHVGGAYDYTGDLNKAGEWHARALEAFEAVHGPKHDLVGTAALNLSRVRERQGRFDEALELARRAQAIWREIKPADDPEHTYADTYVGRVLLRLDRTDEAATLLESALARQIELGMPDVVIAHTRFALGRAVWHREPRRARALLEAASEAYDRAGRYAQTERAELSAWRDEHG